MVFGGVDEERIVLNESSVWSGSRDNEADRPDAHKALPEIRRLLLEGRTSRPRRWSTQFHLPGQRLRPCQRRESAVRLLPDAGQLAAAVRRGASGPALQCASRHRAWSANQEIEFSTDGNVDTKWCVIHEGRPVVWQCEPARRARRHADIDSRRRRTCPRAIRERGNWKAPRTARPGRCSTSTRTSRSSRSGTRPRAYTIAKPAACRFFRFTFMPNPGVTHFQVSEIALDG